VFDRLVLVCLVCQFASLPTRSDATLLEFARGPLLTSVVVLFKVRACLKFANPKISASPRPLVHSPPPLSTRKIQFAKVCLSGFSLKSLGTLSEKRGPFNREG
jgi:hypothetical protein